jgi:hypothetical protein
VDDGATVHDLPDGSIAVVTPIDARTSRIARLVDGAVVWGQVFARGDDHDGQVRGVLASMRSNSVGFVRPWDSNGRTR